MPQLFDNYPGSKGGDGTYHQIISQFPPHEVYIEPYLGGGAIMLSKRPARVSIGIDCNPRIIAAWKTTYHSNMPPGAIFAVDDAINFLSGLQDDPDTLIYCDPPYLIDTRAGQKKLYVYEMFESQEHVRLLNILKAFRHTMIAISGYYSDLYADMLAGWRLHTFMSMTGSGKQAKEHLWMNYPEPTELHDYRYIGANYRERENFRRRAARWQAKLAKMKPTERYALLAALQPELETPAPPVPPAVQAEPNPLAPPLQSLIPWDYPEKDQTDV